MKLEIELLPSRLWGVNLRANKRAWDKIRGACYEAADYRCEICEAQCVRGSGAYAAHEVWKADGSLDRVQFLCRPCHTVKHFGRTQAIGYEQQALEHLMAVNGISLGEAQAHAEKMRARKAGEVEASDSGPRGRGGGGGERQSIPYRYP